MNNTRIEHSKGRCRLCGENSIVDIMELKEMPKSAQFFPSKNEFDLDIPITLNICQCSYCGLVQLDGSPVEYYKDVITATSFSEETKCFRLKELDELIQLFQLTGRRVIEIGCGTGAMLDILEEAGLYAVGLEHRHSSVLEGKSFGRKIVEGFLDEYFIMSADPFEMFVIYNFLEHIPDPNQLIRSIYQITTSDSVGYVTVPNYKHLLDTQCCYEFVADHLSYFTKSTLQYAFYKNGFDILDCYEINNNNDIVVKVQKRCIKSISGMFPGAVSLKKTLHEIIKKYSYQNRSVAVWGAGHRTLSLLALADIKDISYVVDSAKFKQDKYTPILHHLVVSPSYLRENPVDLVIVMVPGIYPDEVLKTIKNMGIKSEVAILKGNEILFEES